MEEGNRTGSLLFYAESEGFKPPIPERGIPDFESSAIDHSANSPNANAKVLQISESTKIIRKKVYSVYFVVVLPHFYGC